MGASSWLNAMPLTDQGLALNKQEFRDSLRLRYDLPLVDLPSHCTCGDKFTVCHALSCKKGGFVAQRHDGVRNLLTTFIDKICNSLRASSLFGSHARFILGASGERPREDWGGGERGRACRRERSPGRSEIPLAENDMHQSISRRK